jgi:CubicO group peptidase (beta-lactamase class C family)
MKISKTVSLLLQKEIKTLLEKGIEEGVFPSAAAGVACGLEKKRIAFIAYSGHAAIYPEKRRLKKQNYFDLASLTKPLATTAAIIALIKEKKVYLDENLSSLYGKKITGEKGKITLRNLLNHSSGFPAHKDYFTILQDVKQSEKNDVIESLILQEPLEYEPGTASLYSDLGFILLGRIIEKKSGTPLANVVEEKILRPLQLHRKIFYNPLVKARTGLSYTDFAATENCPWRKKILCGEVHDDNCYAMGGVAGHSGLFGNIEGVTQYAGILLDIWKGGAEHPNMEKEDMAYFFTRQKEVPGSTWALGFDTPAPAASSSGVYFSHKSVGHLGFTGTSFWIDPEKDVAVVLLSNRVHPGRDNTKIRQFRPYFHDRIMEKLFP